MNENKIKYTIYSAIEDRIIILKKFLDEHNEIFSLEDLCYWWNTDTHFRYNRKYAENVLQVLIEEKCCYAIGKVGGQGFIKTETFVALLKKMLKEEIYLRNLEK